MTVHSEGPVAFVRRAARDWKDILRERLWRAQGSLGSNAPPVTVGDDARLSSAFIEWPSEYSYRPAHIWVDPIRTGLARYVPVRLVKTAAPDSGTEALPVTFNLVLEGQRYPVTIDYCDYMDRVYDAEARSSLLYFKMQYRRSGYTDRSYDASRIVPGGYVTFTPHTYPYLPPVRRHADRKRYSTDVYGRFTLQFAKEIRQRAIELLNQQRDFRYEGGLANVRYSRFLLECAEAKLCLDLPGNGDFCFRLVDYLAIGCCVVGPQHRTRFPVELQDRKDIVYVRRDLADLVEVCRYYLAHDAEREAIAANAREYFDRHLRREQLAGYVIGKCLEQIERVRTGGAG